MAVAVSTLHAGLAVKSGDTIAFMGDSITQGGNKPGGYVSLVMNALKIGDFVFIIADTSAPQQADAYLAADIDWIKPHRRNRRRTPRGFLSHECRGRRDHQHP